MIYSMTGYAATTRAVDGGVLHIELKSVNSRYLDYQFRICDELRIVEPALRELIGTRVARGKLECRLSFVAASGAGKQASLNAELLAHLKTFDSQIRDALPLAAPLAVSDVLRWPGIFGDDGLDIETAAPACLALASDALDEFAASRQREGEKLSAVIRQKVASMRALLRDVEPRIPAALAAFDDRLRQRLRDAVDTVDDDRLRQEVAVFAARIDVAEELARLSTHLDEVERVLSTGGASGKRLDFLMQELNREANTFGSKSLVAELSQLAIEFKILIEQMREQVQNIE
ncbi:MAG: YicC family protein [Candidatus Accumulibacter sp.]|uniref:YicC/YloC family endoribonuclease n=1 Tax=Accumulibacter sp. TaxID=2053492 RepID=UPI0019E81B8A|nr:YicC/YloC family endoribonuclease [Accumulibacter sp.]MBE2259679.1 YicC family protein [Paracoccaceae bacterium]MCB1941242.1 YicC family protein [Accumulibacter sp.]MCP5247438.1 YicC family protein [Accumulibacter sp.]